MDFSENNVVQQGPSATSGASQDVKLVDVTVTDQNVALNLMVTFLGLAQKRGVFTFDESAKIWECIKQFQK